MCDPKDGLIPDQSALRTATALSVVASMTQEDLVVCFILYITLSDFWPTSDTQSTDSSREPAPSFCRRKVASEQGVLRGFLDQTRKYVGCLDIKHFFFSGHARHLFFLGVTFSARRRYLLVEAVISPRVQIMLVAWTRRSCQRHRVKQVARITHTHTCPVLFF